MKTLLPKAALLSALLLAATAHPALAEDEIEIKVGTVAPGGTPWSELLKRIKRRFKKESDGKLKLKAYLGGRLGGEKEMVRETRKGRIQMYGGSSASLATVAPELYVLEAPFLFESAEEADYVFDEHARPHIAKILDKAGFVLYQFSENGWHGLALKETCVKSLSDLEGKKIRSQEARIHIDTFKALGANPVEMSVPEVLSALQAGTVDGFSNTPLFSFATSWYQGIGHFTLSDHIYQPGIIAYSKEWYDEQPEDMKKILMGGIEKDQDFGRSGIRAIKDGLVENFRRSKIEVCEVSPELRADMKKATASVFDDYCKKASSLGKQLCKSIREGKKAYQAKKKS